jgi:hypothetical protein
MRRFLFLLAQNELINFMNTILRITTLLLVTGIISSSCKKDKNPTLTLTLQPANNPTEVHIIGNNTDVESSHNGAPELGASAWTYLGSPITQRGIVRFDLSSIPSTATIKSAKLTLYSNPTPQNGDLVHANSGPNNAMLIQQVVTNWTASTVKWVNQPSTTTANQILIAHTTQPFLDLADIDVKPMVQNMVAGNANYGFMIRLQTETMYNSRIFGSSFYTDAAKHPKLVVEYTK